VKDYVVNDMAKHADMAGTADVADEADALIWC